MDFERDEFIAWAEGYGHLPTAQWIDLALRGRGRTDLGSGRSPQSQHWSKWAPSRLEAVRQPDCRATGGSADKVAFSKAKRSQFFPANPEADQNENRSHGSGALETQPGIYWSHDQRSGKDRRIGNSTVEAHHRTARVLRTLIQ